MQVSRSMRGIFRNIFDPFGVGTFIDEFTLSVGFTYG